MCFNCAAVLGRSDDSFEFVCVIGRDSKDWTEPKGQEDSTKQLETTQARVVTYKQMIDNALRGYAEFLNASEKTSKIYKVLESIERHALNIKVCDQNGGHSIVWH